MEFDDLLIAVLDLNEPYRRMFFLLSGVVPAQADFDVTDPAVTSYLTRLNSAGRIEQLRHALAHTEAIQAAITTP